MKWHILSLLKDFPGSSEVKNLPTNAGDAPGSGILEEELAAHSSIPAWRTPGTEEPGGLQFMRSQKEVRHNLVTK